MNSIILIRFDLVVLGEGFVRPSRSSLVLYGHPLNTCCHSRQNVLGFRLRSTRREAEVIQKSTLKVIPFEPQISPPISALYTKPNATCEVSSSTKTRWTALWTETLSIPLQLLSSSPSSNETCVMHELQNGF